MRRSLFMFTAPILMTRKGRKSRNIANLYGLLKSKLAFLKEFKKTFKYVLTSNSKSVIINKSSKRHNEL